MKPKYKKMLKRMQQKEARVSLGRARDKWFLYILECKDGSFYTGITKDLDRRLRMHNDGKASRYTRIRRPVSLCYREICGSRTRGLTRECKIKALPRNKKEELVEKYLNSRKRKNRG